MMPKHRLARIVGLLVLLVGAGQVVLAGQVFAQAATCADYSSTSAAQFALDINPNLAAALDPDGNGIACDDAGSGQSGSSGTDRTSSDLQLPGTDDAAPTPAGQQGQTDVDAVDQQPTNVTGGQGQPTEQADIAPIGQQEQQTLDGRIGGSRAGWEALHGAPIDEQAGSRPEITLATYTSLPASSSFITLWFNDRAFIILVSAESSWSGAEVAPIIDDLLPTDITSIPDGEVLSDGSLLIPMLSEQMAPSVTAESMTDAGAPGVPGDLYLLLVTDGGERAVEIEIGIGNGDNVREDINAASTTMSTDTPPLLPTTSAPKLPAPTPDTTTTTGASTFLQDTRVEVDRLLAEYDEFMAVLDAGTFTDAEIDRVSAILSGWIALDTSLPSASPEHAALATQVQQVRTDLGSAALLVVTALASDVDDTGIEEALGLLDSAHTTLLDLDQQLTALGV